MPLRPGDSVYLVGMMGCGKSTLGRLLARRLRREFLDSDAVIENRTQVRIPMIFELEGEAGFREREAAVLAELVRIPGIVLATGGGAVLREDNRSALRSHGIVIYLHASIPVLFERTRHTKGRPLLQVADPMQRLAELYRARDPLYRETAHLVVETDNGRTSALVGRVLQGMEKCIRRHPPPAQPS